MTEKVKISISSSTLHILAMLFMLCDHMWAMIFPAAEWLNCIGRAAYPIFAFMIAEGYAHTHSLRKYIMRLFIWACISEIPFDLMYGGSVFYPYHQNVLWTFIISLFLIFLIEKCRKKFKTAVWVLVSVLIAAFGYIVGYAAMVDYYGVGILTVLTFYFFRGKNWKSLFLQLICVYILNVEILGGYYYTVNLFGHEFEIVQQAFALLSLIPIWLYNGQKGIENKVFKYLCYSFYPMHIVILLIVRNIMLG